MTTYEVTLTFTTEQLGTAPSDPEIYKNHIATKKLKDEKQRLMTASKLAGNPNNQCGKVPFKTAAVAEAALASFMGSGSWDGKPMNVYECPQCGKFHFGHTPSTLASLLEEEKTLQAEEVKLLPPDDKGITVFRRDANGLVLLDHMIRGFLKEASTAVSGVWGATSKIDKWLFVKERIIPITREGVQVTEPDGVLERPLRAQTPQGPRTALAASELVKEGSQVRFHLVVFPLGEQDRKMPITEGLLRSWFEYGQYQGLSQWRNGSYGRFTAEIRKV